MLFKKHDPEKLLQDLSDVLGCDCESFREYRKKIRRPEI
jgi:hypothetical protein